MKAAHRDLIRELEEKLNLERIAHERDIREANDKRYEERFIANERAVQETKQATEKRFEGVNEFRAVLADQQRGLMPRPEAEGKWKTADEKIAAILTVLGQRTNESAGARIGLERAIAIAAFIGMLLAIFFRFVPS